MAARMRTLAAFAAGALVVPLSPFASAALADHFPVLRTADRACPPGTTVDRFPDDAGLPFESFINCIAAHQITQGATTTSYNPSGQVSRAQMAQFIHRLGERAGFVFNTTTDPGYTDDDNVTEGARRAIWALSNADIAEGTSATTFTPTGNVSRAQMASFIARAVQAYGVPGFGTTTTDFFDDDNGTTHEANINRIAAAGVAQGTGTPTHRTYGVSQDISRHQMAAFLGRSLDALVEADRIEPLPPPSNQDFAVTPSAAALLTLAPGAPEEGTDDRTYTATGLQAGLTYTVALIDPVNVTTTGGTVTFADAESGGAGNGQADGLGTSAVASIVAVNGGGVPATDEVTGVPVNGTLTVTVDGESTGRVLPVVFLDANANGELDLDEANGPTEQFGVGGSTTYLPPEQAGGPFTAAPVASVDKANDFFVLGTDADARTVFYDEGDAFSVDGVPSTIDAFEAELSAGDDVSGSYAPDPAAPSVFDLANVNPTLTAANATAGTGPSSNDVTVTVTFPANTNLDALVLQRATVTGGTPGAFSTVTTVTPTAAELAAGSVTVVDDDLAAGTYRYQAAGVNDGDQGAFVQSGDVVATTPDTTGPAAVDTRLTTNAGNQLLIGNGDVIRVVFDEEIATPQANATMRISDGDGTVLDLVNGTGTAFTRGTQPVTIGDGTFESDQVLLITFLVEPGTENFPFAVSGTEAGLAIPATVTDAIGVNDAAGNAWNVNAVESDVVIDTEP